MPWKSRHRDGQHFLMKDDPKEYARIRAIRRGHGVGWQYSESFRIEQDNSKLWARIRELKNQGYDVKQVESDKYVRIFIHRPKGYKPSAKSFKVYRTMIGHYGGMYVWIPLEHFEAFKSQFPKGEFPKARIEKKSIVAESGNPTSERVKDFMQEYPNSDGQMMTVYFANASKGSKRLDDLIDSGKVPRPEH
jgi:hypothetical protein